MKVILFLVSSSNLLGATSYLLTGALNGAISCFIGGIQAIINYFFERQNKPIPKWLVLIYALAFIVANLLVFTRISDILGLIAALIFIMAIIQKNGKKYRIWILANALLWAAYDLINASYGPLITHAVQLATTVSGILMHDIKKETATRQHR